MALNNTYGYDFYILYHNVKFVLPITPPSLTMSTDSNNETINLINMGEVNIVKSPPLTTYKFTARFPMRPYPYARNKMYPWTWYFSFFRQMKEEKGHFRFVVYRDSATDVDREIDESKTDFDEKNPTLIASETEITLPEGSDGWGTNVLVTLESMEIKEDSEEGDDVLVDFEFKQYRDYSLVTYKDTTPKQPNDKDIDIGKKGTYVIKKGDTLTKICEIFDDDPKEFVKRNKKVLDAAVARANRPDGIRDCQNGGLLVYGTTVEVVYGDDKKESAEGTLSILDFSKKQEEIRKKKELGILDIDTAIANQYGTKTLHVIKTGDTLTGIAKAYYGDTNKWDLIFKANENITNKDSLKNLDGQTIKIPRDVK